MLYMMDFKYLRDICLQNSELSSSDIFFFATELNPHIEHDQDLLRDLEKNPVPPHKIF